ALGALGPRARHSLPRLMQLLPALRDKDLSTARIGLSTATAVLDIAPERAPALVGLVVEEAIKDSGSQRDFSLRLLGRYAPVARPHLPTMLKAFDSIGNCYYGEQLVPLLTPEHRELLPALMRLDPDGPTLTKANILLAVGLRKEAIVQALRVLRASPADS